MATYGVKVTRFENKKRVPVKGAQVIINTDGEGKTDKEGVVKVKLDKDTPIAAPIVIRGKGFAIGMSGAVLEPDELLEIEV